MFYFWENVAEVINKCTGTAEWIQWKQVHVLRLMIWKEEHPLHLPSSPVGYSTVVLVWLPRSFLTMIRTKYIETASRSVTASVFPAFIPVSMTSNFIPSFLTSSHFGSIS